MSEKNKRVKGKSWQPSISAFLQTHGAKRTATDDKLSSSDHRPIGSIGAARTGVRCTPYRIRKE